MARTIPFDRKLLRERIVTELREYLGNQKSLCGNCQVI
jgi:hypothetical protein